MDANAMTTEQLVTRLIGPSAVKPLVTMTITLASGETFTRTHKGTPRYWKSWLMQQMPYGTSFYGATFSRTVAS